MSADDRIDEELEATLRLDGPGPARRMGASAAASLIDGALDGWEAAPPLEPPAPTPAAASVPWAKVALFAGGVGAVVGAAVVAVVLLWPDAAPPEPTAPPQVQEPTPVRPAAEVEPPPVEDAPVVEEVAEPAPERAAAPAGRRAGRAREPSASAEDLIARGNRLRGERRWADAERSYLAASQARPRSSISHIADVAAAGIRLDHRRDPAGAARLYRRALAARPSGPLALEAREGIARAERRRGSRASERRALEAILTRHAGTRAADRARTRLTELE